MTAQLERLNRDVIELETYINKLKKRGRLDIIPKMMKKKVFLMNHIAEKHQQMQQEVTDRPVVVNYRPINTHGNEMPTYTMKNNDTGEVSTMLLSLEERDDLLSKGTHTQALTTPQFVPQAKSTLRTAGHGWNDILTDVKKASGKDNTIKT